MSTSDKKPEINRDVRTAFKEYMRLDTELKSAGKSLKKVRITIKQHKKTILDWMTTNNIWKLKRRESKGINIFIRKEKEVKTRPTIQQQQQKLADLLKQNITDPMKIMEELKTCAGVRKEMRLYRKKPMTHKKKSKTGEPKNKKQKRVTFAEMDAKDD